MSSQPAALKLSYIIVEVTDINRSVEFFQRKIDLPLDFFDAAFNYASFRVGDDMTIGLVQNSDAQDKHTGIGFTVDDLDSMYQLFLDRGVHFERPPTKEEWGGYLAVFADPDGNTYYLDQIPAEQEQKAQKDDEDAPRIDFSINLTAGTPKTD